MKAVWILLGAAILATVALLLTFADDEADSPPNVVAAQEETGALPEAAVAEAAAPAERTAVGSEPASPTASRAERSVTLEGVVLDVEGAPLSVVRVRATRQQDDLTDFYQAVSNTAGHYRMEVTPGLYRLECDDSRYVTVLEAESRPGFDRSQPVVVAAIKTLVSGLVTNEKLRPLEDALIDLRTPDSLRTRTDFDLSNTAAQTWSASSDADGNFEISAAPQIRGLTCVASCPGFETLSLELEQFPAKGLSITLLRRTRAIATLSGKVFGPDGAPLPETLVAFGLEPKRSDKEGKFEFEYDHAKPPRRLLAVSEGFLPDTLELAPGNSWPPFVEMHLGSEPLSIAGLVLGADNQPLEGARVWIG